MNYRPSCSGRVVIPLLFKMSRDVGVSFEILREVTIESVSNPTLFKLLKPSKPYVRPKKDVTGRGLEVVDSDFRPEFEYVLH